MRYGVAGLALCVVALAATVRVSAQTPDDTINETWPELQVFYKVTPRLQLFLDVSGQSERESSNANGFIGGDVVYALHKYVEVRSGYRFGLTRRPDDDATAENRMLFEATVTAPLGRGWSLNDRNRVELRWLDTGFSERYRNKLELDRQFKVGKRTVTPYAEAEGFYDSRYKVWNRVVLDGGVETAFNKHFTLAVYAGRQSDTRSNPRYTNFLGLKVVLRFGDPK